MSEEKNVYWMVRDVGSGCPRITFESLVMAVEHMELACVEARMKDGGWWNGEPPKFEVNVVLMTEDEFNEMPEGEC